MSALLDTNILVYTADLSNSAKQDIAITCVKKAMAQSAEYAISLQALSEFANVAMKKLGMAPDVVLDYLRFFNTLNIVQPDPALISRGVEIKSLYGIQFYDAMMVAAAERANLNEIWSEDLNAGQHYCGILAVNPFK